MAVHKGKCLSTLGKRTVPKDKMGYVEWQEARVEIHADASLENGTVRVDLVVTDEDGRSFALRLKNDELAAIKRLVEEQEQRIQEYNDWKSGKVQRPSLLGSK